MEQAQSTAGQKSRWTLVDRPWAWRARFAGNLLTKSAARVRLDAKGIVTVETDMTDIGTGSYTIIGQTAAEMMGVPLDKVLCASAIPIFRSSSGSGGQWGCGLLHAGVYAACVKLREAKSRRSLGMNAADAVFADGQIRSATASVALAGGRGPNGLVAEDKIEFGDLDQEAAASDLRRAFRRGRVDAATAKRASPNAGCVRLRANSQPQSGPQPGDRRDDDGSRGCLDGSARRG
jgi:xanthine dehydrogenase YagR molybdenum-binding subunit